MLFKIHELFLNPCTSIYKYLRKFIRLVLYDNIFINFDP